MELEGIYHQTLKCKYIKLKCFSFEHIALYLSSNFEGMKTSFLAASNMIEIL